MTRGLTLTLAFSAAWFGVSESSFAQDAFAEDKVKALSDNHRDDRGLLVRLGDHALTQVVPWP